MELARCNGMVLVQHGSTLGVVERGGGWVPTAGFVAVLLAGILAVNAVVMLARGLWVVGLPLLAAGGAAGAAAVVLGHRRRRLAADAPPAPWLVFDLGARVVRDGRGAVVGSLDGLRLARVFQVGSSSKALAVYCPAKIVIARGNPFGDDVGEVEAALRRHGVGG
jgi:hypothetical protein